jgi:CheY-like chemotaxis protein/nitrogen-specific signal transduction histidine kinase
MERFHQTGEAPVVNQRLELVALNRSGREFPIEITITWPMRVEGGYFFGAFLRDISDRRERDDQLRLAKESAEAATRAKSEFLANMSHELRTPLNGVLGYAQLLQRDRSLNASQREALEAIAKGGAHLLDLINDVLDLSRIEAGRLDIEAATTDLAQMAIDLKYLVAESARRKGLLLGMAIASDTPRRVVLDGRHLRQVLLNLLNNAVKFTPQGEVHLSIAKAGEDRLLFEVSDTGVGIESGDLVAIFEAFTQTKSGAAAGGSGPRARHQPAPHRQDGRRAARPESAGPGQPVLLRPAARARGRVGQRRHRSRSRGAAARRAAGRRRGRGGARGGRQHGEPADPRGAARERGRARHHRGRRPRSGGAGAQASPQRDLHGPEGWPTSMASKPRGGWRPTATADIPVIAVTASAFGDTRTEALSAGCVDYLPKPVRAGALFATLQKHLGVRFVSSLAASRSRWRPPACRSASTSRPGFARPIDLGADHRSRSAGAGADERRGRRPGARTPDRRDGPVVRLRGVAGAGGRPRIGRALGPMTSRTTDAALTPPAATILVVDDSPVNLQVLVRTLHGTGHRILAARDGRTALDIVSARGPTWCCST